MVGQSQVKPPYVVPSMAEINALDWNGFNVVSTFSGGGGSCTGYRMAGYRVLYANEFIPAAQATYKANHPSSYLDGRDIRQVSAGDILSKIGLKAGELDLLDGSPPCSAFSTAGKRESGWGKAKSYSDDATQVVDDLFFEYCRLLKGLQPKVFVAENVSGLIKGSAKGYFKLILQSLKDCGYRVKAQLLNAAWLGVPQGRERLIFMGVRDDLQRDPVFPKPFPYCYTTRDSLPHLAQVKHGGAPNRWLSADKVHPTVVASWVSPTAYLSGGSYVTESGIAQARRLTIAECRRICSFPADYALAGDEKQQWERMGRSVPPLMMRAISATIRDEILGKL